MLSSLLNVVYLLSIVGRAFFLPAPKGTPRKWSEASVLVWGPPVATAIGCVILFFYAGYVADFLAPIAQVTP